MQVHKGWIIIIYLFLLFLSYLTAYLVFSQNTFSIFLFNNKNNCFIITAIIEWLNIE